MSGMRDWQTSRERIDHEQHQVAYYRKNRVDPFQLEAVPEPNYALVGRIAKALCHPVRVRVLEELEDKRSRILSAASAITPRPEAFGVSAAAMAEEIEEELLTVANHYKALREYGMIMRLSGADGRGGPGRLHVLTQDGLLAARTVNTIARADL